MFTSVQVCACAVLIWSVFATVWNRAALSNGKPPAWQWLWRGRWRVGLLLGVLSLFSGYVQYQDPMREAVTKYRGLPFIVGVEVNGSSDPYILGVIAWQLNFLFWLLLPQAILWVSWRCHRKSAIEVTPVR